VSIVVHCPACGARASVPDKLAGRKVQCPRCQVELPSPTAAGPPPADWSSAPPPVRRPALQSAPEPGPTADADPPAPQEPDSYPPLEQVGDDEPEPWYYRFIQRYVPVLLCVWIFFITLGFVGYTAMLLFIGAETTKVPQLGGATAGCSLFFAWLALAVGYALAVCGAVFAASWLLVALDAARNLRLIRLKMPGR
jgi:hypothetical protein